MSHEVYIFGSAVRGEVSSTSDIDILVLPFNSDRAQFPAAWSIYSPDLIKEYFDEGKLFAWHLYSEARCIYTPYKTPFLETLGAPAPYTTMRQDISDLWELLRGAIGEIELGTSNLVYELGISYTAIRDIAMSASWKLLGNPCFSRNVPYMLSVKCPLSFEAYENAMLARHSSTRGIEINFDIVRVAQEIAREAWDKWVQSLREA